MENSYRTIPVRVARVDTVTPLIKRFTLEAADGGTLPPFTGGSHVIVQMRDGEQRYSNAYSLMSSPAALGTYQIGVRRETPSKGGSAFLHDRVKEGDLLDITTPNNLFALSDDARHHVLIAGGIGITPFMSQMHELGRRGASHELHYAFRGPEHGAFGQELEELAGQSSGKVRFYVDSLGQQLDLGGQSGALVDVACAVEMVHAASLILDDMPCMDNAMLRRGRPTIHVQFGEDVAILAAIGLLSRAFGIVASAREIPAAIRSRLVARLSETIGDQGLVKGQFLDLRGSRRTAADIAVTNELKTGVLLGVAVDMAAIIAETDDGVAASLRAFALAAGQAFQIRDDFQAGPGTDSAGAIGKVL